MKTKIKAEEIIKLMKQSWELGGDRLSGRHWLQKKLCCGGDSIEVHRNTLYSLLEKGLIEYGQKYEGDAFWLVRYRLRK
jgi:hypothetical protein